MTLQNLTRKLQRLIPFLDDWTITAQYVAEGHWPKQHKGDTAYVCYFMHLKHAQVFVRLGWRDRCRHRTLAELIGHELAHIVLDGLRAEKRCDRVGATLGRILGR